MAHGSWTGQSHLPYDQPENEERLINERFDCKREHLLQCMSQLLSRSFELVVNIG